MVFCLNIADFPCLRKLKLAIVGIDNFPFKLLAKENWPELLSLDLSNTHISADAMEDLKNGNWLLLEEVTMRYCGLDAKSIAHLVEANWPCLKCLQLEGDFMEALAFWRLGKGAWSLLEVLHAIDGLTCAAWACMMRGNWPHMQSVSVGSGSMSVSSCRMPNTPNCCWSDLKQCVTWESYISAPIIAWIARAWSHRLQTIDLTHCQIPGAAFRPFNKLTAVC